MEIQDLTPRSGEREALGTPREEEEEEEKEEEIGEEKEAKRTERKEGKEEDLGKCIVRALWVSALCVRCG